MQQESPQRCINYGFFTLPNTRLSYPMLYGLSNIQLLTVVAPVSGALITSLVYLFAYDKKENSRIASEAESERWDEVKRQYGKMVSTHHMGIVNAANTFIDLTDQDDSADAMEDFISDTVEFEELHASFSSMKQPSHYHRTCRRGAEFSPWAFISSTVLILASFFSPSNITIILDIFAVILFLFALVLTGVFLYYRSKMNGVADDLQFKT